MPLFRLFQLALVLVQYAQIIHRIECRCVLCTPRFLLSLSALTDTSLPPRSACLEPSTVRSDCSLCRVSMCALGPMPSRIPSALASTFSPPPGTCLAFGVVLRPGNSPLSRPPTAQHRGWWSRLIACDANRPFFKNDTGSPSSLPTDSAMQSKASQYWLTSVGLFNASNVQSWPLACGPGRGISLH